MTNKSLHAMKHRKFAHLHLHTHYSMLDGFNRVPELVQQTKKFGMDSVAITDHGNLYGAVEFYTECRKSGIKPILGYEAYLAPGDRREKKAARKGDAYSHLTLLAKNNAGFKNLIKLASIAFLDGYYYKPRIDREVLKAHSEGLICLSGCLAGEFNQAILADRVDDAQTIAEWFAKVFKDDFYIEIQNNGIGAQDLCTPVAADLSDKLGVPLVATADAHYLCADDAEAHDVLFCISTGQKHDPKKKRYPEEKMPNPYYVRTPQDMYRLFPDFEDAVGRSQEIANGVDVQLDFGKRCFPTFTLPKKQTPESYLRELCQTGMKERYSHILGGTGLQTGAAESESKGKGKKAKKGASEDAGLTNSASTGLETGATTVTWDAVKKRLEHELGIIEKMGFASYFLVVWDFVRFAREKGIPSTARGSGCGAIVSYVLYLSHVCPIEYDLLFERFLDPNREEAPDIDIDFCQDRRDEVIQYVKEKYGAESVAQIGTFGTLAAKAAIKDVGRVLGVPFERVSFLCELVPMHGQIAGSLEEAMKSLDFRKEYDTDPEVKQLVDIAMKLEGCNRSVGTHAAGVVIADGPITDYVPVQRPKKSNDDSSAADADTVTTQWEMGILEKVGMLKMDILGLRNLTVLDKCVKLIKKTRGEDIDPAKFDLLDKKTYELFQSGNVKGVFQLESQGIRDLLKRMKPDGIRDLIAVLALYRPGPLSGGMVDSYVNRKHGREKWDYPHPVLKDILDETYGVMVYQEQIMRILNRLGGIELSKAYAVIKAISKKVEEKIAGSRVDFVTGCKKNGVDEAIAEEIFDKIVLFASYGFNKSHSTAYALISYQTAYLKSHYMAEFMAAMLSSEMDEGSKRKLMVEHIEDARSLGIKVLPPDVNTSLAEFGASNNCVSFGLTAIKGLGRGAADKIVLARNEGGKFKDFYDFTERLDRGAVSKLGIERLAMAGALDEFGRRTALMAVMSQAFRSADKHAHDRSRGQKDIFELSINDIEASGGSAKGLPDLPEWPDAEKLKFEKEALSFYFSGHPLSQHEIELSRFRTHGAVQAVKLASYSSVLLAGMVAAVQARTLQSNRKRWAMFQLEDFTGRCKCILWPETYAQHKELLIEDTVLLFEGYVKRQDGNSTDGDVIIRNVLGIEAAKQRVVRELVLRMPYGEDDESLSKLDLIGSVLNRHRGLTPVLLSVSDPQGKQVTLKLGASFRVNTTNLRVEDLEAIVGLGSVLFII